MAEFFNVLPPNEARALLLRHVRPLNEPETIPTVDSLGRVTAEDIFAPHALPTFRRSTMDGYAVRAADTHGAGESLPALLRVVGEVEMGRGTDVLLRAGDAAIVHTGGMIPPQANAVVQVEHTQVADPAAEGQFPFEIEVSRAVAVGQNVIQIGEDIAVRARIVPAGTILRPQEVGGLLALGLETVRVARRPRVIILATGDEVVPPAVEPAPGQIRDINSYTVAGQAARAGGLPIVSGIVSDDLEALQRAATAALAQGDMVVLSAGSSVSSRDMTVDVIDGLGEPGVLLHGVATRPGKPTIVGAVAGKPVLGLPGNPVSAMIQFDMFGAPAIYALLGLASPPPALTTQARLSHNIASETGREDYVPVRLAHTATGMMATPLFGKSNLIYTLVQADGLVKVPINMGGLLAGEWVEVRFF
jgi:molybdopterin molybdotransferase